ncbi:MAG: hypothetical protein AB8B86_16655 [Pseudomonadales bacterium]
MHQNILAYKNRRYLIVALVVAVLSIALYLSQGGAQPANGGTWQGYVLGTLGALLIVWLSILGVRKRRYSSAIGTVQGWTSAHVYLGALLLLVGTLHCAAQFGWNVHTLAYVLMTAVILSGFYGIYVYLHYPRKMADNRLNQSRQHWLDELAEIDEQAASVSAECGADVQSTVTSAIALTRYGGGFFAQLSGRDKSKVQVAQSDGGGKAQANTDQQLVIDRLAKRVPRSNKRSEAAGLNELLTLFSRRQMILRVLRKDIRMQGLVKVWLFIHIPMTVALLGALLVHIVSVFVYW